MNIIRDLFSVEHFHGDVRSTLFVSHEVDAAERTDAERLDYVESVTPKRSLKRCIQSNCYFHTQSLVRSQLSFRKRK